MILSATDKSHLPAFPGFQSNGLLPVHCSWADWLLVATRTESGWPLLLPLSRVLQSAVQLPSVYGDWMSPPSFYSETLSVKPPWGCSTVPHQFFNQIK